MKWNDRTDPLGVIDETIYTLQCAENVPFELIDWAQHQYADRVTDPVAYVVEKQRAELAGRVAMGVRELLAKGGGLPFYKVVHGDPDGLDILCRVQIRAVDPLSSAAASNTTIAEPLTSHRQGPYLLLTLRHAAFAMAGLQDYAEHGGVINVMDESTHEVVTLEVRRRLD